MAKTDVLELKILWTIDEIDEETEDEPFQYFGVDFIINGVSLFEMIREIEILYFEEEGHPDLAGDYALESADIMHRMIMAVINEKDYADEGFSLYCCAECHFADCWGVYCKLKEDGDYMVMKDFEHNHRNLIYPFEFRFTKENFYSEIKKLTSAELYAE